MRRKTLAEEFEQVLFWCVYAWIAARLWTIGTSAEGQEIDHDYGIVIDESYVNPATYQPPAQPRTVYQQPVTYQQPTTYAAPDCPS